MEGSRRVETRRFGTGTPSVRTAADARTSGGSRDGTASTRRARRTMAPAKKGARARARRNLICVARSSRARRAFDIDGARATEDSREALRLTTDG